MAIHRGEVYFVDLEPKVGREQGGRRPVVVVSNDSLNSLPLVVVVVPGTRGSKVKKDHPGNIRVPAGEANLPQETVFLAFQVRALDQARFQDPPIGRLSQAQMDRLDQALAWTFTLQITTPPQP
jgi:mRNA interferase MazF